MMTKHYAASLVLTLLIAPRCLADVKLSGEWVGRDDDLETRLIFKPDKTVRSFAKDGGMSGTYSVDYSKTPYHFDIRWSIDGEDLQLAAILEFKGNDEIRISAAGFNKERPKDFTGKVCVLRRVAAKMSEQGLLRVGEIAIVGNDLTKNESIRRYLSIYPGQILPTKEELLKIEIELLMKFHRRFDLDAGERPRIEIQDGTGEFRDVVIAFPEKTRKKK
jgi:hypothetical protein